MTADVLNSADRGPAFLLLCPVSSLCAETGPFYLRIEATCEQRPNVVEQTPSRLGAAAHFVCSIYHSNADEEIYEQNKGSHQLWVNRESEGNREEKKV